MVPDSQIVDNGTGCKGTNNLRFRQILSTLFRFFVLFPPLDIC